MLDKKLQSELVAKGRAFMQGHMDDDRYAEEFESDQQLKLPQPPLVKAPMVGEDRRTALPLEFDGLLEKVDLTQVIADRHSSRVYTQETMTLAQLSYILWATQGVKGLRGKSYATLRTVPSGGARHPFETYMIVRSVEGLAPGAYHYLPMEHAIEFLGEVADIDSTVVESISGQAWGGKANVVLYWSMVAYRAEWRYGIYAHRPALIDAGHVGQNCYLACTGLGLGCCGIAAFNHKMICDMFGLDGTEEYPVYVMPVGTVRDTDKAAEQSFYKFVEDQGL